MAQAGMSRSLVSPESSDPLKRRALKNVNVPSGAAANPTASDKGFNTYGARYLHITVELPDATTTLDWELWLWDHISEKWCLDTRNGTNGTVSLADVDADNPQLNIVEIPGVERVFVKLDNGTGTFTNGANVWLSSVENVAST